MVWFWYFTTYLCFTWSIFSTSLTYKRVSKQRFFCKAKSCNEPTLILFNHSNKRMYCKIQDAQKHPIQAISQKKKIFTSIFSNIVIEFQNNYDTIQNSRCIKKVKIYFLQFCPRLTPHVYWCDQRTYLVYLAFVAVKRHLTPRSSVILALNTGGTCCIFSLPMCLSLWTYFPKHLSYLCI